MPIWKRRARETAQDEFLTFLGAEQANRLRTMVRAAFAERGIEVNVYVDHARDEAGRMFGLWNLALTCRNNPAGERAWPRVVANHVRIALATVDQDHFENMPVSEVLSRTYARLAPDDMIPNWRNYSYAREPVPGLRGLLALDLPETVGTFNDEHVCEYGAEDLFRAGMANLRALPVERREHLAGDEGAHFDVVLGDSFFTASRVLVMPELLRQVFGHTAPSYGVLVCMPDRHQVGLHVIADQSLISSLKAMIGFARAGYAEGAGAISPHVYWWHNGSWQQLSRTSDDGTRVEIHVDSEFGQVLEAVASAH